MICQLSAMSWTSKVSLQLISCHKCTNSLLKTVILSVVFEQRLGAVRLDEIYCISKYGENFVRNNFPRMKVIVPEPCSPRDFQ